MSSGQIEGSRMVNASQSRGPRTPTRGAHARDEQIPDQFLWQQNAQGESPSRSDRVHALWSKRHTEASLMPPAQTRRPAFPITQLFHSFSWVRLHPQCNTDLLGPFGDGATSETSELGNAHVAEPGKLGCFRRPRP